MPCHVCIATMKFTGHLKRRCLHDLSTINIIIMAVCYRSSRSSEQIIEIGESNSCVVPHQCTACLEGKVSADRHALCHLLVCKRTLVSDRCLRRSETCGKQRSSWHPKVGREDIRDHVRRILDQRSCTIPVCIRPFNLHEENFRLKIVIVFKNAAW